MMKERNARTIMVVEDDADMASIYKEILEQHGNSVLITAEGTKDALRQFIEMRKAPSKRSPASELNHGNNKDKVEVAIIDKRLPDGDGMELSKELLRMDPTLEIVLATADTIARDEAKRTGIGVVLQKPFPMSVLLSTISSIRKETEGGVETRERKRGAGEESFK
jgi:DNA-binding response OmpR family regulator